MRDAERRGAGARAQMLRRCGKARASGWAKRRALPCGLHVCAAVTQPGHSCGPRAGLCLPHDSTAAASRFLPTPARRTAAPHAPPPARTMSSPPPRRGWPGPAASAAAAAAAMRMERMAKAGGRPGAGFRRRGGGGVQRRSRRRRQLTRRWWRRRTMQCRGRGLGRQRGRRWGGGGRSYLPCRGRRWRQTRPPPAPCHRLTRPAAVPPPRSLFAAADGPHDRSGPGTPPGEPAGGGGAREVGVVSGVGKVRGAWRGVLCESIWGPSALRSPVEPAAAAAE